MVDWKDATIHVASHVIHYGTGVFEGIRAYDSKTRHQRLPARAAHAALIDSCRVYRMEPQWSQAELSQAVLDTVRVNGFKSCYIRPLIYPRLRLARRSTRCPARSKPRSSCGNGTR